MTMSLRTALHILVLLIAASASGTLHAEDPFQAFGVKTTEAGRPAPDFTLNELNGGTITLSGLGGKVVLVNFWASWCAPCRKEMPALQRIWEEYRGQGLELLAVSADSGGRKPIDKVVERYRLGFPILLDPEGEVREQYQISVLPMTYLIDRSGTIVGKVYGEREWDGPEGRALIRALLDGETPR